MYLSFENYFYIENQIGRFNKPWNINHGCSSMHLPASTFMIGQELINLFARSQEVLREVEAMRQYQEPNIENIEK